MLCPFAVPRRVLGRWPVVLPLLLALALAQAMPTAAHPATADPARFHVVDLHVDLAYQATWEGHALERGGGQYVAAWLRAAGVVGAVLPLFVPQRAGARGPTMEHLEAAHALLREKLPGIAPYTLDTCRGETDRVEAFLAFEGAGPVGDAPDSVFRWARRGIRLYGLVHTSDNPLASSAGLGPGSPSTQRGLSATGRELVRRVHATGGMIDVSHASDATIADVLRHAAADAVPVVATHSNARALAPHTRNLTDAQLRAIASSGGVVGINFHAPYLLGGSGTAEIADVVRHVRHVATVAGIDAVAIGSDFEGGIRPPRGLTDVRGFPALAAALLADGFSPEAVRKILGQNALRVLCGAQRPR